MKIAIFIKNPALKLDERLLSLKAKLSDAGFEYYMGEPGAFQAQEGTDAVLSVGGDGTFLSAARYAAPLGIPVLGINLGRMGFLADADAQTALQALLSGNYKIEDRGILSLKTDAPLGDMWHYAFNEIAISRRDSAMLGVDVAIDGKLLPTYWADGILVATSSGSTAYSLSVGGPICTPDSRVLIVAPIAPHNLNLRPLIVPDSAKIEIALQKRSGEANITLDSRIAIMSPSDRLEISLAQFSLKRFCLPQADFIAALKSKLFWGEDVRNK